MGTSLPQEHAYIGISHQIGVNHGSEEPLLIGNGDDYISFLNVGQDLPPLLRGAADGRPRSENRADEVGRG